MHKKNPRKVNKKIKDFWEESQMEFSDEKTFLKDMKQMLRDLRTSPAHNAIMGLA